MGLFAIAIVLASAHGSDSRRSRTRILTEYLGQLEEVLERRTADDDLFTAALSKDVTKVRAALSAGADVNYVKDGLSGKTSVLLAAVQGRPATPEVGNWKFMIVKTLLGRSNIDVEGGANFRTEKTPMAGACEWASTDIIRLLLDKRAKIPDSCFDYDGVSRVMEGHERFEALLEKNKETAEYRWKCDDLVNDGLNDAQQKLLLGACKGEKQEVEDALAAGVDVMTQDKNENTALHWAANQGQTDVVDLLMTKINEPSAYIQRNRDGNSPLYEAVKVGSAACNEVAKKLLDHYSNYDIKHPNRDMLNAFGLITKKLAAAGKKAREDELRGLLDIMDIVPMVKSDLVDSVGL